MPRARVEDVVLSSSIVGRAWALVATRGTDRSLRQGQRLDQLLWLERIADTDAPRLTVLVVATGNKQVAVRVDGIIRAGTQFLRGQIDGEALGDGSEAQEQLAAAA